MKISYLVNTSFKMFFTNIIFQLLLCWGLSPIAHGIISFWASGWSPGLQYPNPLKDSSFSLPITPLF